MFTKAAAIVLPPRALRIKFRPQRCVAYYRGAERDHGGYSRDTCIRLIDRRSRSRDRTVITRRISCRTPFNVEFARTSRTRKGGPTLVPYDDGS